ncbi:MAG TPA: prohibitin family protein [Desulfobacterales bacterium]|nr:prohibitin family protein [Desulfobacterales bacterium]
MATSAETEYQDFQESKKNETEETVFQKIKAGLRKMFLSMAVPLLILLFVATYLIQNIAITLLPGEAGVFWSRFLGGTRINYVYPEGMHFILPWDKIYVYNVRIQEISSELTVLARSGLHVLVYFSVRYAPDKRMLGVLHQKVGPDYANKVIIPQIESVIRDVIGTMEAEQIYTTGREVLAKALDQAIEQIARRYVNVDVVLIRKLELPPVVADAIVFKIKQKQMVQAHEFIVQKEKKEAERKRIEGQGIRDQNEIITTSLTDEKILRWHGIQAVKAFATSENAKTFVIGVGENGVPIILNPESPEKK